MRGCWQRWLFPVFVAAALLHAAPPAKKVLTVDGLDSLVSRVGNLSDKSAARELSAAILSERASYARLEKWKAKLRGERSQQVIMAVADASAFLNPPAAEIPSTPAPDLETQKQIVARMVEYTKKALHKLPNFSAVRTTTSFRVATDLALRGESMFPGSVKWDNASQDYRALGAAFSIASPNAQLYWIGSTAQSIAYRDGAEVLGRSAQGARLDKPAANQLTTRGEFGSILEIVLVDVPGLTWKRWEQCEGGPVAVFTYSVPRDRSHFVVQSNLDDPPEFPAYRGEVAVDPDTGSIFRLTIEAWGRDGKFSGESSILVEYRPTGIGGKTYICPFRAVAMVKFFDAKADMDAQPAPLPLQISINDISFTGFHLFRSESRIVAAPVEPENK